MNDLATGTVEHWRWDKFKVGDRVTWADDRYADMTRGRKRHGDGPFIILAVENAPYAASDVPYTLTKGPPEESRWAAMGHTQDVTVEHDGRDVRYSGAFFRCVP